MNSCESCCVNNELYPFVPYEFKQKCMDIRINQLNKFKEPIVGDVASYYINYIPNLLNEFENIKVIVLKRDKKGVIKSFMNKMGLNLLGTNDFWRHEFVNSFPTYKNLSLKDCLSKYYDDYYKQLNKYIEVFNNIKVFNVNDLNTREGLKNIFDFLEIPEKDRKYVVGLKKNVGKR